MSRRKLLVVASLPFLIIALFVGGISLVRYKHYRDRAHWKTSAIRQLAAMTISNEPILTELHQIRNPTPTLNFGWAHDHVILMTNGECLMYAWWHGANSGFVDHLFLAHGTDRKWYYSTYHFCTSMVGISGDDPPGSIREFAARYSLREFDGKSDDCLKHTWPSRK